MIEAILKRDRAVVLACLLGVTALAWIYLFSLTPATDMDTMPGMDMGSTNAGGLLVGFVMWAVMMVGMMVTPATPMILLFAKVSRTRRAAAQPYVPVAAFLLGYLVVWMVAAFIAAAAQWQLSRAALLAPDIAIHSPVASGALLILAGLYQWSPLKHACLRRCRSPLEFLLFGWRDGSAGALRMGVEHGFYCLGCCWLLMAVLFAVGVMNLAFVAAIGIFVLLEKVAPFGPRIVRASGGALAGAGAYLIFRASGL